MKNLRLLIIPLLAVLGMMPTPRPNLSSSPQVSFVTQEYRVAVNETATSEIALQAEDEVFGLTLAVAFNPDRLTVDPTAIQPINTLATWQPQTDYLLETTTPVEKERGLATFFINLIVLNQTGGGLPDEPFLAIPWQAGDVAITSQLRVNSESYAVDENGAALNLALNDGLQTTIQIGDGETVPVQVRLEGGKSTGAVQTDQGWQTTTIELAGEWLILPADGELALQNPLPSPTLTIRRAGYLPFVLENVSGETTVELLAGDFNGDGQINIFDLSIIASRYDQPVPQPPSAELEQLDIIQNGNSGSQIDIFDLSAVAGNYGAGRE